MCFISADVCLMGLYVLFCSSLYIYTQYDDNEDTLCLDDDSEDISYLEMLNARLVNYYFCQLL